MSDLDGALETCTLQLLGKADTPLPLPALARYWPDDSDDGPLEPSSVGRRTATGWIVPLTQLSNIHFLACHRAADVQPGSDFLFWYWFTQELKGLLVRDQ